MFATITLAAAASPAGPKPFPDPRPPDGPPYVAGEILVKFRREAPLASRGGVRSEVAGRVMRRFASGVERWSLGAGVGVEAALAQIRGSFEVDYAEPNYLLHAVRTPDDPFFGQQWPLLNTGQAGGSAGSDIDATGAWDTSTGGTSVVVAILDTGLDLDHPDLAPNLWTNPDEIPGNLVDDDGNGLVDDVHGWDFVNHDDDPRDDNGHGTHVAGILGATGDNGAGISGVAWRASLMPLKFLDRAGAGNTADAIQAIEYAVAHGARILNASWGGHDFSRAMLETIVDAGAHELLFVAAAGNDGEDSDRIPFFPAGYAAGNVVAVAATDRRDRLATFSNFGRTTVDVAAPGVEVFSTLPGGIYGVSSGTSMATPHVSGVAALILGFRADVPAASLKSRLLDRAERVTALDGRVGSGRINALQCLIDADNVAPGPVADLRIAEPLSDGFALAWTATGDDGTLGTAAAYDVRVSEEPFDADDLTVQARAPVSGPPLPGGSPESKEVSGLAPSRTYHLAVRAVDEWGNTGPPGFATGTTRPPPVLQASPADSSASLLSGQTRTSLLTLRNDSAGTLDWSIDRTIQRLVAVRGDLGTERYGGPDGFGYAFTDSDEPGGPVFAWRDISDSGRSALIADDDAISAPIPIGFPFPFYGQTFTSLRITSNGFLSFTHDTAPYENQPLPSPGAPGNLVAPYWDDLRVWGLQDALWLAEPDAFTVQFNGVLRMGGGGPYTFQVVLRDSGDILFQYLQMLDTQDSATIGLQDASGEAGLPVVFNAPYVHDRLAVLFEVQQDWLTASPRSGRLRAFESTTVGLTFDAVDLPGGTYQGRVPILTNDPDQPRLEHPVTLTVEGARAIGVEPATVDFGSVFAAYGSQRDLAIVNRGSLPLTVTTVVTDDVAVITDPAPPAVFVLAPGERLPLTLDWSPSGLGSFHANLRIESDAVNAPSLVVPLVGNALNTPPQAAAIWPEAEVECSGVDGSPVVFDASPSYDEDSLPGGLSDIDRYEWFENPGAAGETLLGTGSRLTRTLPFGPHRIGLRVTDRHGGTGSAETTVTIVDTAPPALSVAASPATLWPANHRMVPVSVTWVAQDVCFGSAPVRLVAVTSSEPDDAPGRVDGRTKNDIAGEVPGTADASLLLRAERIVSGPGRVYTIRYVATDGAGLSTPAEALVTVTIDTTRTTRRR